jgi:hypothetical protein
LRLHGVQVLHVRVCSTQESARHLAALLAAAYHLYALQVRSLPDCHLSCHLEVEMVIHGILMTMVAL